MFLPVAATAQDSHELADIQAALRASQSQGSKLSAAADALAKEVADLQHQLVTSGAEAREAESALERTESELAELDRRKAFRRAELAMRRQALIASLAALERLALTPPGAAMVSASPLDVARGEMLLKLVVPELQRRTALLEDDLAALRGLESEIAARRQQAVALTDHLEADGRRIAAFLAQKAALQKTTVAAAAASAARSAQLAAEAKDLHDLLDRLARQRAAQPAPAAPAGSRAFPATPGGLVMPVSGPVVGHFGEPDGAGSTAKGISILARPGSAVLAPYDGEIVFRGPFRSYGEILIIQHAGGYHSLLAGLGRSDAAVGQWVIAGEPVGVMGPPQDGNSKLYVELRRDGHPIDPAPWLGKSDTKVE